MILQNDKKQENWPWKIRFRLCKFQKTVNTFLCPPERFCMYELCKELKKLKKLQTSKLQS